MMGTMRTFLCASIFLLGFLISLNAHAQAVAVFDDSATYEATVGNLLFSVDFSGGTNTLVSGQSFNQLITFSSPGAANPSVVFWSAPEGGIQNASSPAGTLSGRFVGLSNALAFRFSASLTPPTVTLLDGAGAVIDERTASSSGFYGVVSPTSIEEVLIDADQSLTLEAFQANQEIIPQSDTTPPQITSLSIVPALVDVTSTARIAIVTLDVSDDLSGIESAWVRFYSPSRQQFTDFTIATVVSGDSLSQTRRAEITFPQFIEAGDWEISVFTRDIVSNFSYVPNEALVTLGLPTTIEVVSNEDTEPPELTSLTLSPQEVDVSGGDQSVVVSLGVQDTIAGAVFSGGTTGGAAVQVRSPSGQVVQSIHKVRFTLVSGTPQDGIWEGTLPIPQFSEAGAWTVSYVGLEDAAGNLAYLYTPELDALGFAIPELSVVSSPQDLEPPQLVGFSFTPALVNTTAGSANVTVTLNLTDDLSGVRNDFIDFFQPPLVRFSSPSGGQSRYEWLDLTFGTALDGTWQGDIVLPQFSEQGTYNPFISGSDVVGNRFSFDEAFLQSQGFSTDLIVIRPTLDVDGIIDPDTGGTVNDDVFGSQASITFPPGVLDQTTEVAIDVFVDPLDIPTPAGFIAPGTLFVNIDLTPEPDFPLPPPGITTVLPLVSPGVPGTILNLARVDPATGILVPVPRFDGSPVTGTVDPDGTTATFHGIALLSVVVGLVPAESGDLNADSCVDRDDYAILMDAIRDPVPANPFLDLNGDGVVSRADGRTLVGLFTNPRGAACN